MSSMAEPVDVRVARAIGLEPHYSEGVDAWLVKLPWRVSRCVVDSYSENRNAAMGALERFCEMHGYSIEKFPHGYRVRIPLGEKGVAIGEQRELPAAICAAILEASK